MRADPRAQTGAAAAAMRRFAGDGCVAATAAICSLVAAASRLSGGTRRPSSVVWPPHRRAPVTGDGCFVAERPTRGLPVGRPKPPSCREAQKWAATAAIRGRVLRPRHCCIAAERDSVEGRQLRRCVSLRGTAALRLGGPLAGLTAWSECHRVCRSRGPGSGRLRAGLGQGFVQGNFFFLVPCPPLTDAASLGRHAEGPAPRD